MCSVKELEALQPKVFAIAIKCYQYTHKVGKLKNILMLFVKHTRTLHIKSKRLKQRKSCKSKSVWILSMRT